ncbi:hypothetical protein CCR85_05580 [Rhodothalassium salexigens]|uniref:hypothetical protein n=1 Tax=Rhodothalassium salexigens TaxID=1086 RepID=UPI001913131F|nr:hypothetical protein [Rhodothalassium salexigens]MBK5910963.1 hypothetical protein [Rhodothalassium salexigens]MBK5921258.1 hypothetical protein [Rhodothalassium salexigens]
MKREIESHWAGVPIDASGDDTAVGDEALGDKAVGDQTVSDEAVGDDAPSRNRSGARRGWRRVPSSFAAALAVTAALALPVHAQAPAPPDTDGLIPICTALGLVYVDPETGEPVKRAPGGGAPCHAACRTTSDDQDDETGAPA